METTARVSRQGRLEGMEQPEGRKSRTGRTMVERKRTAMEPDAGKGTPIQGMDIRQQRAAASRGCRKKPGTDMDRAESASHRGGNMLEMGMARNRTTAKK